MATGTAEQTAVIPESEDFYEIIDGQRVELPPMGAHEVLLANQLVVPLANFARAHNLGRAVMEMLFDLGPIVNRNRRPDVAFVSFERWPEDQTILAGNAWDVVPDLAVEIVSPNDRADELLAKVLEYFRAGVWLVWVIYPSHGMALIHESPTTIRVLQRGDALDGGAVLPGFHLPLATLLGNQPAGPSPGPNPNPDA
jgi:Uma2 family endonuclease